MEKLRENKKLFLSRECQRSSLQDSNLIRVGETAPRGGGVLSLLQSIPSSPFLQARGLLQPHGYWYVSAVVTFSLTAGYNCSVGSAGSINETKQ